MQVSFQGTGGSTLPVSINHRGAPAAVEATATLSAKAEDGKFYPLGGHVYLNKNNPLVPGDNVRRCLFTHPAGGFYLESCFSSSPDIIATAPGKYRIDITAGADSGSLVFDYDGLMLKSAPEPTAIKAEPRAKKAV